MRKVLQWGWVPVLLAFGYSGWVLYDRKAENERIEAEQERNRTKREAVILEKLGDKVKVVAFYANPPMIRKGTRGMLCYGVVNATEVRIEPLVPDVGPALSRCVEVALEATTTYTLIAQDDKGTEARSVATIGVQ